MSEPARPARRRFEVLLHRIFEEPERRDEVVAEIEAEFAREAAVLVLDTSGFTRTVRQHGIYAFLLMIHQMKLLAAPAVEAHGGRVVKGEADNLFCLFPDCAGAVAAGHQILTTLEAATVRFPRETQLYGSVGIAQGRVIDLAGEDLFGDCVNLACKLGEDLAQRGEMLISEEAFATLGPGAVGRPATASVSGLTLAYRVLREGG